MIKFGTEVVVTHRLQLTKKLIMTKERRVIEYNDDLNSIVDGNKKDYTHSDYRSYAVQELDKPIRGFVVRTVFLKEGWKEWNGEYNEFRETRTVRAYEVSWHNVRKPLLVLPEHTHVAELGHE